MTKISLACLGVVFAVIFPVTVHAQGKLVTKTEIVDGRLKSGLQVELHTPDTIQRKVGGKENTVRSVLDDSSSSRWLFRFSSKEYQEPAYDTGDDFVTLLVKLKIPVVVTSVTLRLCQPSDRGAYLRPKQVYILRELSSAPGFPWEAFYPLSKRKTVQTIKLPQYDRYSWSNLFPTRRVMVDVTDVYGNVKKSAVVCLAGINLTYVPTKIGTYKPQYSWGALKRKLLAHVAHYPNGNWTSPAMAHEKLSYEFMYYILTGNKEARRLFEKYQPEDVSRGEVLDGMWRPAVDELLGGKGKQLKHP